MKDSEVIAAARELISDPAKWIKGDWCVGRNNGMKMCAEGAVRQVLGMMAWVPAANIPGRGYWRSSVPASEVWSQVDRIEGKLAETASELLPEVLEEYGTGASLSSFNDAEVTKHEDVLAIFDKTQSKLEEAGE